MKKLFYLTLILFGCGSVETSSAVHQIPDVDLDYGPPYNTKIDQPLDPPDDWDPNVCEDSDSEDSCSTEEECEWECEV